MKSATRLALLGLPLGAALLLPTTARAWEWPNHDNQSPLNVKLSNFECGGGRLFVTITNSGSPSKSDTFTLKADKQVVDTQQLDPGDDPAREVVHLPPGGPVQISVYSELTNSQIFFKQLGIHCGGNGGGNRGGCNRWGGGGWGQGGWGQGGRGQGGWGQGGWGQGGWGQGGWGGGRGDNCGNGCDHGGGGWNGNCGGRRLPFTGPPADLWGKVATAGGLMLTGGIAWWYGSIWPRQNYDGTITAGRTRSRRRWPGLNI
ncbi:hypothetical protein ACIBHX_50830 [Nonomuraea sp. NPDC050536]|uniref:hypothetical protein n=1 Tax=Nonomuraea sp. NPDC050536 TaxID=3364366 RepID=UPI0037C58688